MVQRGEFPRPRALRPDIPPALEAVLQLVQRGEFPRPRALRPYIPPALEAVCLKAMALAPEDRYPSPVDLAEDLERWLADEPVLAFPEGWFGRLARGMRRHYAGVQAGAVASLIVAVVAFGATFTVNTARQDA